MRPLLRVAGVPPKQINIRIDNAKLDTLLKAFDWLHNVKLSKEWEDIEYAWALLPEETWRKYKLFDIQDLREQVILESAQKALRKLWKTNRPRIFGTAKEKKSGDLV